MKTIGIIALLMFSAHFVKALEPSLSDKKITAETISSTIKDNYSAAAKKAGLPHVANPAAWFRDNCRNVTSHKLIDDCISNLKLVQTKIVEVEAEYQAQADALNTCKEYRQAIKDATLQQFTSFPDNQKWTKVFQALKCISQER